MQIITANEIFDIPENMCVVEEITEGTKFQAGGVSDRSLLYQGPGLPSHVSILPLPDWLLDSTHPGQTQERSGYDS